MNVAFFALLYDQDLKTPIEAFARDEAGNETKAMFVDDVFEKPIKKSRIDIDDGFINRTVPDIIAHSPELKMSGPSGDLLADFLKVNGSCAASTPTRSRRSPNSRRRRSYGKSRSSSLATQRSRPVLPTTERTSTKGKKSISRSISGSIWR